MSEDTFSDLRLDQEEDPLLINSVVQGCVQLTKTFAVTRKQKTHKFVLFLKVEMQPHFLTIDLFLFLVV